MTFDLHAKNFSLTYARADSLSTDRIIANLQLLGVAEGLVALEHHLDGGIHYHCWCRYNKKLRIRNARFFDLDGVHPNIQPTRDVDSWIQYCKKAGDFRAFGTPSGRSTTGWAKCLLCTSEPEFLGSVRAHSPRDYILSHERLRDFGRSHFTRRTIYISDPSYIFSLPDALESYVRGGFLERPRPLSLILLGGSRLGKTVWARSLGRHMYFNNLFNIDDWDQDAEYIIFDDFDFQYMPGKKAFFGAQKNFVLTDKYRGKRTIEWGKPFIYVNNVSPDFGDDSLWYSLNTVTVHIFNKLY